jgi:ribosomal-protein-alanine N-acetyltransferase
MRQEDVDAVREIDRLSFPSSWSAESYLRDLRNCSSYYVVARLNGEIIGYAGMWLIADEAHISTLAVHPNRRRCGLGKCLLSQLIDAAHERGATEITLEVREANIAARALYERSGFKSTGFIPRYYGDTGENAVVMSLGRPSSGTMEEWPE